MKSRNKKDEDSSSSNGQVQLKREMGLFSAVSMLVGVMIGSGIFISPVSALRYTGSVGFCLIIWVVCGIISLLGALAFAELGTVVPRSGAEYAYFQEAFSGLHPYFGRLPAFICSFIYIVVLKPAEVAVLVLTFSEYTIQPFSHMFGYHYLTAYHQEMLKKLLGILTLGVYSVYLHRDLKLYERVN